MCTAIDAQGRIQSLWLVQDTQAVRQLAAYTYADQTDGSSDLVAAQDEDQHSWTYAYLPASAQADAPSTHLLRHYRDRTGRGIHLHWMHEDGFAHALTPANSARAKAWREHADDGSFVWNRHIRLATVVDALGQAREYYFDIRGYVYRVVHPEVQGADGLAYRHQEWFFRDAQANITRHLHADGSRDDYAYDARGNLVRHSRADGSTVHFAYDAQDNLTGIRDAEGHAWHRAYDGSHLVEESDPLGHITRYAWNEQGLPVEITDAKGGKKTLAYDSAGQLIRYTDCSGKTSTWAYDARGRLVQARNAAGETTRYVYARGQLAQVVLPDNTREHYEHDAEGRLLLHRDALQRETRYDYGPAGLIAQRTDAAGQRLGYSWDRLGRLVALRNENDRVHRFGYDRLGRLLAEEHFDKAVTEYGYDSASGILAWTREADARTDLGFDPLGRLTWRRASLWAVPKDYAGRPIEGQPLQQTPDSVREARYAYDGNGRLVDARNAGIHLPWFHDPVGNVQAEHQHYQLNARGEPLTQPRTAVWRHRYDELGHRTHTTRPDGHSLSWLTYGSGHVHGLMLDELEVLQIERDDLHRETRRTQANRITEQRQYDAAGRLKAQLLGRAERLAQRPGSLQRLPLALSPGQDSPTSAFNLQRSYTYDAAGQLIGIADSLRGSLSYRYDPVGRLLQAHSRLGQEIFAFDPASNMLDLPPQPEDEGLRLSTTPGSGASLDPEAAARRLPPILDNLLKDYAGTHYDWDARGNLLRRRHNGELTQFTWNAANELEEVIRNGSVRTRYWYDPLGRRIGKFSEPIVHVPPDAGSRYGASEYARRAKEEGLGGVVYGWDGDQLAWETDYVRQQTLHYVHEQGSFVPLLQATTRVEMLACMLQRPKDVAREYEGADGYDMDRDPLYNGSWHPGLDDKGELLAPLTRLHFYQCDHLGTPQALTDEQGEIAWEANYRAWGQARITIQEAARKAGLHNPIRFQGQYFDEESGLHYNRHRYYDPHSGRFVSKDPIGLLGGLNLHQYAPNTLEWIDPLGLAGNRANRRAGQILQDQQAASGGHAYSRHGAHTTMPQQEHRATTGIPPDNPCPRRPRPINSTRFLSNVDQLDAIQRATQAMDRNGTNAETIDMGRAIGEGYRAGGGCPVTTTKARVVRGPNGIATAYPILPP
ncbi:RHS repeat-associated core domain-containing protein [uncultured Pseudacidovorax sp.]|uniref:RHS repeat-associated core domain-containing protein n=1 Tax=uncultured Pseudacidovorax sp. TaxID=679313 RepID=UPI0025F2A6B2|nr:RHS repeat-associated core domain-containing protein [uncultured Pseudacidovorax sp.]